MNVSMKNIRKLMGLCQNSKVTETGSQINPANFEVHNRSGDEKASRDLSRMERTGLLLASIGSFVSALTLFMEKDNLSSIMVGLGILLFLIGIILYIRS